MRRATLIVLAIVACIGFTVLGLWQIERRAWKLDLIARVERGIHAAPIDAFEAEGQVYRRVKVSGELLYDRETLVQAVTARGAGYWVMTPMRTQRGYVLINRGFVPQDKRGTGNPNCGPARLQTMTGLLRLSEPGGGFLRTNDAVHDRWYSRDVTAIAKARGVRPAADFFIDADATSQHAGYPIGGLTVVRFPNNHLIYALTWFALAALSAFAALLLARRER